MKKRKGFILAGVVIVLLFLLIVVPVMVKWVQDDTKISVKDQKSTTAFNLAEAAVDRGYWKVKSSTGIFAEVSAGGALTGYSYDAVYADIPGGSYRVRITSGPDLDQITIFGEGRDSGNNETRSIKAVYTNTSVPGAILSGKAITATADSVVHWGPIMAKGDITVPNSATLSDHFPRKLSMNTVHPFDTNTDPPNTDSLEWWSNYNVPELPIFDFTTMKASAALTGTLNCQDVAVTSTTYTTTPAYSGSACTDPGPGCSCVEQQCTGSACSHPGSNCSCSGSGDSKVCTGRTCTDPGDNCNCVPKRCTGTGCADTGNPCDYNPTVTTTTANITEMQCCNSAGVFGGPITCGYGGSDGCTNCTVNDIFHQTTLRDKDYTWYWDHNATWGGYTGIRGTVIVMGNMTIDTVSHDDRYCRSNDTTNSLPATPGCTVSVPPNAWKEYQKFDTVAADEYPGDLGLRSSALTYKIGTSGTESSGSGGDLGVYGFLYVGGNFTRGGASDIYGSMWVAGDVIGTGNTMVFYNSKLKLPTLNVVLTKESWQEQ